MPVSSSRLFAASLKSLPTLGLNPFQRRRVEWSPAAPIKLPEPDSHLLAKLLKLDASESIMVVKQAERLPNHFTCRAITPASDLATNQPLKLRGKRHVHACQYRQDVSL
jgi:hypothetical protein